MLSKTILLHIMRNMVISDNNLIREGLRVLRRRLPSGWNVSEATRDARGPIDVVAKIAAPDRRTGTIAIEARVHLEPKGVRPLVDAARQAAKEGALVVISRYVSE